LTIFLVIFISMSLVRVVIRGISYSHSQNGAYALILGEVSGSLKIPIVIGAFEAQSIAIALENELNPPRPLTHDLFKNMAEEYNIRVKQIFIHKLENGIFYSNIITEQNDREVILDARTSDAVAIAVRFNAPIFVYKDILDQAGVNLSVVEDPKPDEQSLEEVIESFLSADEQDKKDEFSSYSKENLSKLLESAVLDEDYERAARIRDEIRKREI